MALSLLVMFTGYLRPSEVMWFRIQRRVTKDAKKEFKTPLSTFLIHPLRQMVDKCVTAPILPEGFSLYMLRHGVVTSGVLPGNRERLAARTRGRWPSDVMLEKNGTPDLIAKLVDAIPLKVTVVGERVMAVDATILRLFFGDLAIPLPILAPGARREVRRRPRRR